MTAPLGMAVCRAMTEYSGKCGGIIGFENFVIHQAHLITVQFVQSCVFLRPYPGRIFNRADI